MTATRSRRRLTVVVALTAFAGALAVLRPWTVVPIRSTTTATFDPVAYVASIWDSRVLQTAEAAAIDLRTFVEGRAAVAPAGSGAARAVFVQGRATVAHIDRTSRIGLARLRLPWADGADVAAIQIGPVLRGTALRDALEFIRFTDFVNQLEFAGVANALNDRVLRDVVGPLDMDEWVGREVAFVGAVSAANAGRTLEIVPVQVAVTGGLR